MGRGEICLAKRGLFVAHSWPGWGWRPWGARVIRERMRWSAERPGRGLGHWLAASHMRGRARERWWVGRLERSAERSWGMSRIDMIGTIIGITAKIAITGRGRW